MVQPAASQSARTHETSRHKHRCLNVTWLVGQWMSRCHIAMLPYERIQLQAVHHCQRPGFWYFLMWSPMSRVWSGRRRDQAFLCHWVTCQATMHFEPMKKGRNRLFEAVCCWYMIHDWIYNIHELVLIATLTEKTYTVDLIIADTF